MITFKRTLEDIIWQHIGERDGVFICDSVKDVGEKLQRIRRSQYTTQGRASVSEFTVISIERGRPNVSCGKIQQYADGLGFDLRFVLLDRDAKRII